MGRGDQIINLIIVIMTSKWIYSFIFLNLFKLGWMPLFPPPHLFGINSRPLSQALVLGSHKLASLIGDVQLKVLREIQQRTFEMQRSLDGILW